MISKNTWRAISLGIPIITALFLAGLLSGLNLTLNTNIADTGLMPWHILFVLQLILAYAIYKNLT